MIAASAVSVEKAQPLVLVGGLKLRVELLDGSEVLARKLYGRKETLQKVLDDVREQTGKNNAKLCWNGIPLAPELKLEHVFLLAECAHQTTLLLHAVLPTTSVVLSIDMGIRNFAFWAGKLGGESVFDFETVAWDCVDVIAATGADVVSAKSARIEECADVLEDYVDNFWPEMGDVRTILIEQQPVAGRFGNTPNNVRMNILSFLLRSLLRKKYPDADVVQFVSPRLKMKIVDIEAVIPEGKTWAELSKAQQYTCNKKAAIHTVQKHTTIPFRKGQKKDDYSDCLLQALAWLQQKDDLDAKNTRIQCRKLLAAVRKQQKTKARKCK